MRRTAIMLLQHGPLQLAEFHEIMGGASYSTHYLLLKKLIEDGLVKRLKIGLYGLPEAADRVPGPTRLEGVCDRAGEGTGCRRERTVHRPAGASKSGGRAETAEITH